MIQKIKNFIGDIFNSMTYQMYIFLFFVVIGLVRVVYLFRKDNKLEEKIKMGKDGKTPPGENTFSRFKN